MAEAPTATLAFCGNIGNLHYQIVRALRSAGWDAHLFVGRSDQLSYRPESDDATLLEGYPDWIHEGDWLRFRDVARPWRAPLLDKLKLFDVVVASGNLPIVVQFAQRPWVFLTTGADVTKNPFPIAFWKQRPNLLHRVGYFLTSFWQGRAIRRATRIWTQPFAPFLGALARLGVEPQRISNAWVNLTIDTDTFSPGSGNSENVIPLIGSSGEFIVFHPTRLVFGDAPHLRRSGQWKGSRTVLEGFAQFVRETTADRRPCLVLPLRGHRDEEEEARKAIQQLGIEANVLWLDPPRAAGFTRTELVELYRASDVSIDEFGSGWFGYVSIESMSCGVPVISRLDIDAVTQMYGDDWFWLHAQDAQQLSDRLAEVAADPDAAAGLGSAARDWVIRRHGSAATEAYYRRTFGELLDELLPSDSPSNA